MVDSNIAADPNKIKTTYSGLKDHLAKVLKKNIKVDDTGKDEKAIVEDDGVFYAQMTGDEVHISNEAKAGYAKIDITDEGYSKEERAALGMNSSSGLFDKVAGGDSVTLTVEKFDAVKALVQRFAKIFGYSEEKAWQMFLNNKLADFDYVSAEKTKAAYEGQFTAFTGKKDVTDKRYVSFLQKEKQVSADNPMLKEIPVNATAETGTQAVLKYSYERGQTDFSEKAIDAYVKTNAAKPVEKQDSTPTSPGGVPSVEPELAKGATVKSDGPSALEGQKEEVSARKPLEIVKGRNNWFESSTELVRDFKPGTEITVTKNDGTQYKVTGDGKNLYADPIAPNTTAPTTVNQVVVDIVGPDIKANRAEAKILKQFARAGRTDNDKPASFKNARVAFNQTAAPVQAASAGDTQVVAVQRPVAKPELIKQQEAPPLPLEKIKTGKEAAGPGNASNAETEGIISLIKSAAMPNIEDIRAAANAQKQEKHEKYIADKRTIDAQAKEAKVLVRDLRALKLNGEAKNLERSIGELEQTVRKERKYNPDVTAVKIAEFKQGFKSSKQTLVAKIRSDQAAMVAKKEDPLIGKDRVAVASANAILTGEWKETPVQPPVEPIVKNKQKEQPKPGFDVSTVYKPSGEQPKTGTVAAASPSEDPKPAQAKAAENKAPVVKQPEVPSKTVAEVKPQPKVEDAQSQPKPVDITADVAKKNGTSSTVVTATVVQKPAAEKKIDPKNELAEADKLAKQGKYDDAIGKLQPMLEKNMTDENKTKVSDTIKGYETKKTEIATANQKREAEAAVLQTKKDVLKARIDKDVRDLIGTGNGELKKLAAALNAAKPEKAEGMLSGAETRLANYNAIQPRLDEAKQIAEKMPDKGEANALVKSAELLLAAAATGKNYDAALAAHGGKVETAQKAIKIYESISPVADLNSEDVIWLEMLRYREAELPIGKNLADVLKENGLASDLFKDGLVVGDYAYKNKSDLRPAEVLNLKQKHEQSVALSSKLKMSAYALGEVDSIMTGGSDGKVTIDEARMFVLVKRAEKIKQYPGTPEQVKAKIGTSLAEVKATGGEYRSPAKQQPMIDQLAKTLGEAENELLNGANLGTVVDGIKAKAFKGDRSALVSIHYMAEALIAGATSDEIAKTTGNEKLLAELLQRIDQDRKADRAAAQAIINKRFAEANRLSTIPTTPTQWNALRNKFSDKVAGILDKLYVKKPGRADGYFLVSEKGQIKFIAIDASPDVQRAVDEANKSFKRLPVPDGEEFQWSKYGYRDQSIVDTSESGVLFDPDLLVKEGYLRNEGRFTEKFTGKRSDFDINKPKNGERSAITDEIETKIFESLMAKWRMQGWHRIHFDDARSQNLPLIF